MGSAASAGNCLQASKTLSEQADAFNWLRERGGVAFVFDFKNKCLKTDIESLKVLWNLILSQ
jgi:hypothetical protein